MPLFALPTRPETDTASIVADVVTARGGCCDDLTGVLDHVADILRGVDDPRPDQVEQAAEEALGGLVVRH